jgi:hypothetical protein
MISVKSGNAHTMMTAAIMPSVIISNKNHVCFQRNPAREMVDKRVERLLFIRGVDDTGICSLPVRQACFPENVSQK